LAYAVEVSTEKPKKLCLNSYTCEVRSPTGAKERTMENRVKNKLEYLFHCSPKLLYRYISNPSGLEEWFAEQVNLKQGNYIFTWDDSPREAALEENKLNSHTRFRWLDDPDEEFFEFRLRQDELTGEVSLTITDFCDSEEQEQNQRLWDNAVNALRTRLGA